jgi:hypothetical protein
MSYLPNRKTLNLSISVCVLVALALAGSPVHQAQAAVAPISVPVDKGWMTFSWSPNVRGPFAFTTLFTSIDPVRLTRPALLTFVATAKITCPPKGEAAVGVRFYDFRRLILSTSYKVTCAPAPTPIDPTVVRSPDSYLADAHFLHGSVPIPSGGAHNIVVETDLATTDKLFWGYLRVDTAPGVPPTDAIGSGAIALTVVNPPANAWVGVQWADPAGAQWFNVDNWSAPLVQDADGRMAYWVEPEHYGTGPYRWVVYDQDPRQGGKLWGVSDPFNFPVQKGDWIWTKVMKSSMPAQ